MKKVRIKNIVIRFAAIILLLLAAALISTIVYLKANKHLYVMDAATACYLDVPGEWDPRMKFNQILNCNGTKNALFSEAEKRCVQCPAKTKPVCNNGVVSCQNKKLFTGF